MSVCVAPNVDVQKMLKMLSCFVYASIVVTMFTSFFKVTEMNRAGYGGADVDVDTLFKNALHKYHGNLLFTCGNNVQV